MRQYLLLLGLLYLSLHSFGQQSTGLAGPSLENTIDWASNNVINVSLNDSRQIRQKLSYDLENYCQCRLNVKTLSKSGNLQTAVYTFDFEDIDPETIRFEEYEGVIEISLKTYEHNDAIKVRYNVNEEDTDMLLIYEKNTENASRLVRAFAHVSRLCKK